MASAIERLTLELDTAETWPLRRERGAQETVARRRAWRLQDVEQLRTLHKWGERFGVNRRDYVVDPLARTMAKAWGSFLFGECPQVVPPNLADADLYAAIEAANGFESRLPRAERICWSEGEVWWHVYVDTEVSAVSPLVEWVSRSRVLPLYRGDRVMAVAFVSKVDAARGGVVYRLAEIHGDGEMFNVLYRGTNRKLGERVPLTASDVTADLPEGWAHGLGMMAGRVVDDLDDDGMLGVSDLDTVESLLFGLNEARTIADENARLTAKRRIYTTERFLRDTGTLDAGIDVFVSEGEGGTLGESSAPPVREVELSYDAAPLILHTHEKVETILSRCGIVPTMISGAVDGQAESGTAIRLRFLPTVNAAKTKGGEWDAVLPELMLLLARLAALPTSSGGLGQRLVEGVLPPAVTRGEPLPIDQPETVQTNATAVTAGIRSRDVAVREQHPEWDDDQVEQELARIEAEHSTTPPLSLDGPTPPLPQPMPADPAATLPVEQTPPAPAAG